MLNTTSVNTVNRSRFSQRFVQPCYDSYCFSNLPSTIEFLLTGNGQSALPLDVFGNFPTRYDKVIFFFIDAFGWQFFERYAEKYHFLKTVLSQGVVSKMTSQFPSTTAAHVTCMHTGLNVGQSGVYEWNYYEPLVDEIISPLLFSYAGDKTARDTLKQRSDIPPPAFFPRQTFYRALQAQGVTSHIFQYHAYTPSTFSDIVFRGATVHPYQNLPEAFGALSELVTTKSMTPAYYFLYYDRIDTVCHNHGPTSRQFEDAVDTYLTTLDQFFYKAIRGKTNNTLFMLTADHGHTPVDPRRTFYLNKRLSEIKSSLKTNKRGSLLVPAGSPRDMFLHVKDEKIDELLPYLQERLAGIAEIYRTDDLLRQHFFGLQEPSPALLSRLGNVVILPYKNETVWWYEEGKFDMHFFGHHGGLTPEEMETPLMILPL
ncbi:MAG TPA: alkaline phosphatase family protein [Ktedonobacteraceae bacterium]|nr:alkaline phosphatase family protein [Ktedonobacteraceae bacterium]